MWLIGQDGFSSTVKFVPAKDQAMAQRFGATDPAGDYLLVRGRDRQQLNLIAQRFGLELDADTAADYKYRLVLTREQFKTYMAEQIDAIDYTAHFKEASMSRPVNRGFRKWSAALYAIWTELELVQDTPAYQTKVWPRNNWTYPQAGKHSAAESASAFAQVYGWDSLLEPEVQGTRLELEGASDGYRFTDRMLDDDELDDPFLWDLDTDSRFADLTDDELMELSEYGEWHRLNDQILRENEELAAVGCTSETIASTLDQSPSKQRRRNRRQRNRQKGK